MGRLISTSSAPIETNSFKEFSYTATTSLSRLDKSRSFTIPIFFFNDLNDLEFGGGVIYKITEKFIYFKNLIFAVVFALTFIFLILLFNKNPKNYLIVFLLCLISFDFVFQKYYDPLLLIVFFTLIDSEKITTLVNGQAFRLKIIYLFYFIFLVSANFYYYN